MSFEPDPYVTIRIKAEAARLAECVVDLVDDAKQLSDEFVISLKEVADVCEPADFAKLVIDHLPASMQAVLSVSELGLPELLQMVPDLKATGMDSDAIRELMRERVARMASPLAAHGFSMGFPPHSAAGHSHVVVDSPRALRIEKVIDQLLARETGVVRNGGHKWLLCQIVLRSGYRFTGAMRKHESDLLQMMVDGKAPTGEIVQLEHYFDYDDIETIAQPVTAPPRSPIVSG